MWPESRPAATRSVAWATGGRAEGGWYPAERGRAGRASAGDLAGRSMASGWPRAARRAQQATLQRPHRGLLVGLRVVPAADVQDAMGDEQPQLVGGGPADVAGVAATTGLRLFHRPLHRHDDVAEVQPAARRQGEERRLRRPERSSGRDAAGTPRAGPAGTTARPSGRPCPCASAFSPASSASSARISPIDAGAGAPAASSAAATTRPRAAPPSGDRTPSRTSRSIRHGGR